LDHRKSLVIFEISTFHAYDEYLKIVRDVEEEICNVKRPGLSNYSNPILNW